MSDYNLSEIASAEIVPNMGGPNGYLVRFGEGVYDTLNKSGKNTLLLKSDFSLNDNVEYGGITVSYDLSAEEITLTDGEDVVQVPVDKHENVLWALYDEDVTRIQRLFDKLYVPTVRQGLMDMLMPRFRSPSDDIKKTDDGWLINEEILVAWDASNSPVKVGQTHVVSGGKTVPADTQKDARDIRFNLPDDRTVALPNGTQTSLDDVEMKFLTSVALIVDTPQTGLYDDGLSTAINDSRIAGFTDTKSGLHHGHGLGKHRLSDLGVTDEAADRLWYNEYDHAGVHELALREEEFRSAPIPVFENAPNTDSAKWAKIDSTREKAPIPKQVRSELEARYE